MTGGVVKMSCTLSMNLVYCLFWMICVMEQPLRSSRCGAVAPPVSVSLTGRLTNLYFLQ